MTGSLRFHHHLYSDPHPRVQGTLLFFSHSILWWNKMWTGNFIWKSIQTSPRFQYSWWWGYHIWLESESSKIYQQNMYTKKLSRVESSADFLRDVLLGCPWKILTKKRWKMHKNKRSTLIWWLRKFIREFLSKSFTKVKTCKKVFEATRRL